MRVLALDNATVRNPVGVVARAATPVRPVDPKGRLFLHANGRPVRPDWLTRRFAKLVKELGLPPVRLHDLRHGAASIAGAAGVDLKAIQHNMGHYSPVTTAETYISVFQQMAHTAVRATAQLLLSHARVRMSLEGRLPNGGRQTQDRQPVVLRAHDHRPGRPAADLRADHDSRHRAAVSATRLMSHGLVAS